MTRIFELPTNVPLGTVIDIPADDDLVIVARSGVTIDIPDYSYIGYLKHRIKTVREEMAEYKKEWNGRYPHYLDDDIRDIEGRIIMFGGQLDD